ncbi:hypothetical protein SKAU_G00105970 [Synaphobranchus kaupii]|uniref:Uncharacterized protein n=1 Tax=Synaphobranchus kaupii TaxID=118154 RepID=A0A9Q1FZ70_SYNKA|nr:hypothetical protein SKAU_G00105970 [Synaphobranchus kaupii]
MQPIRETDWTALDKCTARYSSPASWEAVDWLLLKEQQQQTIALQNLSHIPGDESNEFDQDSDIGVWLLRS